MKLYIEQMPTLAPHFRLSNGTREIKMQVQWLYSHIRSGRYMRALLAALVLCSGCFQWVPIEPGFANGQTKRLSKVRIGGESGEEVLKAQVAWPKLFVIKGGQPLSLDLRETPVVRRKLTRGGIAAIVVPSVIGGLIITMATALLILAPLAAGVAGG